jgi:hypothetical protein
MAINLIKVEGYVYNYILYTVMDKIGDFEILQVFDEENESVERDEYYLLKFKNLIIASSKSPIILNSECETIKY